MLFNTINFGWFFLLLALLFFMLPQRHRWLFLLFCNLLYYFCFKAEYLVLLLIAIGVSYLCGLGMAREKKRRFWLVLGLTVNIGILVFFKYFNFLSHSLMDLGGTLGHPVTLPLLTWILPVGISFYTFTASGYLIDVYRRKVEAERHAGYYAAFISFFPSIVSGPIERAGNLLPQLRRQGEFDGARAAAGMRLMLWGFFKKLVVADRLAIYVNAVFGNPDPHSGATLLVGSFFFTFQIYCDFSGYTDIAIGVARILGFDLMRNFNRPYFSRSISEFWRRWHISLSSWFRDYLYIPLGGSRVSVPRIYLNLFIVFFVSGMWHGANWTFLVWGGLHGLYAVSSRFSQTGRDRIAAALHVPAVVRRGWAIAVTFLLVNFAWVYFRASDLATANKIMLKIFSADYSRLFIPAMDQFIYSLVAIALLLAVDLLQERRSLAAWLDARPLPLRWAVYGAVCLLILLMGIFNGSQFIYAQF
ncbi:MAG TPA: MBOAT family O-acyltransferase [bacterium]|nr:MBOAT family O-acyltransferase [bacterium]HPR87841.1 MBOAT family O-acyltransferase [bacterium]